MANDRLFEMLAQAKAQPSGWARSFNAFGDATGDIVGGYREGQKWGDEMRKRKLEQQTLGDALGGQPVEQGIMNLTGESGAIQHPNLEALASFLKAKKEARQKGTQLFGTRGDKGLVFDPNESAISEIPIPPGNEPIMPKAMAPTLSPYADPSGQPLSYTPGRGLSPTPSAGGTPVLKQGNEQAINDVSLLQSQIPNIKPMFDAYRNSKYPRIQATPAGRLLDPVGKQAENSLKLAAFTFGGKNLTENEKQVVYGALFPSWTDNAQSLPLKEKLLTDFTAGKIDLLQAANLLGPAGVPLRSMLQAKQQSEPQMPGMLDPEAEAAIARVQAANIDPNQKKARIAGIRAAAGQR